jgi:hypothetical protein
MPTIGAFTQGVARLIQAGAIEYDESDVPQGVTDLWAVILGRGVRPQLADISGLPARGTRHPVYTYLVRSGITIRSAAEQQGSLVWMIEVKYEPQGDGGTSVVNPGDDPDDPGVESAVRILERAWPIYEVEADLVADVASGDPVLNSAGEPFDRAVQVKRRYMGARVKRAEQNWPKLAASLDGTINQQAVTFPQAQIDEQYAALPAEIRRISSGASSPCAPCLRHSAT